MKKNKKTQLAPTIFVWVMFIFILVLSFVFNINKIKRVLEETKFVEVVFGIPQPNTTLPLPPENGKSTAIIQDETLNVDLLAPLQIEETDLTVVAPDEIKADPQLESDIIDIATTVNTEKVNPNTTKTQMVKLYFVMIEGDGKLLRKDVTRLIPHSQAPLKGTIMSLLNGPDIEDVEKGLISLIPAGTVLLSASVQNKMAVLDFNDDFQFNNYGVDGYLGQLMQVVFTATEFFSIDSVQILIEGKKQDYLGGEGVWIGSPLSQMSFK
ncbi:MAG: GerMN domain-containing protein [Treponemataceae bacterium]